MNIFNDNTFEVDSLLGPERNVIKNVKSLEDFDLSFADPKYCKYYFVKFCPYELLRHTKGDIGPCRRIHDDSMRRKYIMLGSENQKKFPYEHDFCAFLDNLLADVQRKIRRTQFRLVKEARERPTQATRPEQGLAEKIAEVSKKLENTLNQMEELGEQGEVEESEALIPLVQQLKTEKVNLQEQLEVIKSERIKRIEAISQLDESQLAVKHILCPLCAAQLSPEEDDIRHETHANGKQHKAFLDIESTWKMLSDRIRNKRRPDHPQVRSIHKSKLQGSQRQKRNRSPPSESVRKYYNDVDRFGRSRNYYKMGTKYQSKVPHIEAEEEISNVDQKEVDIGEVVVD